MKKLLIGCLTAVVASAAMFGGCLTASGVDGKDGIDGKDGQDVSIREIYEETNSARKEAGLEELDFLEFISEYLSYDNNQLQEITSLQTSINRSLLSGVSILTRFAYKGTYSDGRPSWLGGGGGTYTYEYHKVYSGAGVIIDLDKSSGDAYVITNCHVVYSDTSKEQFANEVYLYLYGQDTPNVNYSVNYYNYVELSNGSKLSGIADEFIMNDEGYRIEAEVVSASITYDIALLKVSGSEVLKSSNALTAEFASSDDVFAGEDVYAVGNPQGYGMAATAGIVSKESELIALSLSDSNSSSSAKEYRVIRTDAAINGGNSGGGLYNKCGELIGIINSKAASEDIDNMGFALPGSNVKRLVELMKHDHKSGKAFSSSGIVRAVLSAEYSTKSCVSYWNTAKNRVEVEEKVVISSDCGELKSGDILKHITIKDASGNIVEDMDITRLYHLEDTLLSVRNGYTLTFKVARGGVETTVNGEYEFKNIV